jgi:AcrR family transcriptional regulator
MGEGTRRGRPRDEALTARRQEEILAAAATAFACGGYPDTDVQAVADAAGVAKGTIYLYFPSKERLFLATVDRAMSRLCETVRQACADVPDPLDRLEVGVRAYLQFFRDHPDFAELLIIERAEYRDRKTPTYLEHRQKNACEWAGVYAGLIRDGRIRDMPVQRILDTVSDMLYGTMFTNHFSGRQRPPAEQARDLIDVLFHGILTPEERDRRGRA